MGAYDNERRIHADVGMVENPEVCFLPEPTDGAMTFLFAVRDAPSWSESERPDLYSDEHQLAIEVMRVDDHPKVGKVTNPTLARESELEREVRAAFPMMKPDIPIFVLATTGLPSGKDHNFRAYRDSFSRIVGNHATKVERYRENHPGYALALLVHDESSAYAEMEELTGREPAEGERFRGRPHNWFLDSDFTQIIAKSGADFFFWHTPFKHIWHVDRFGERRKAVLPSLAVYDIAAMEGWKDPLTYDPDRLVSVEE